MEFVVVFSFNGSLVSYRVEKKGAEQFTATLKSNGEKKAGLPEVIQITCSEGKWEGHPEHPQLTEALMQAILYENH